MKIVKFLFAVAVILTAYNMLHSWGDSVRGFGTIIGGGELLLIVLVPTLYYVIKKWRVR